MARLPAHRPAAAPNLMRGIAIALAAVLASAAPAQVPDASIKLNLYANYFSDPTGRTTIRLYDTLGHLSTVGLRLRTDLGFQAFAAQKLQIIPHGGDPDQLDEYYVESPGSWIVGKQYLPFGQGSLLHESALAVSSSLTIAPLELPLTVAACDAGPGRQLGVVARLGDHFGASAAIGEHFGIAGTSFALIRPPTQAADVGHGFRQIYGIDFSSRQDEWEFRGEAVTLRGPETSTDRTDVVVDATVHYDPTSRRGYEVGITHSARERADFVRFQAFVRPLAQLSIEPLIRFRNFELFDVSVALHVKF
ncbi:MAG: hypothetical protein ACYC96_02210 [Fimbriimonadaceae bacterium]